MDELKEMLAREIAVRKRLSVILIILIVVLVGGGGVFLMMLMQLQGSLNTLLDTLEQLDIEALNTSIQKLNEILETIDVDRLNTSMENTSQILESTAKILQEVTEKMEKISSFSLFD